MTQSFMPVSGFDLPRFAGLPTFMRLPYIAQDDVANSGVEVGIIGVPWDGGDDQSTRRSSRSASAA